MDRRASRTLPGPPVRGTLPGATGISTLHRLPALV